MVSTRLAVVVALILLVSVTWLVSQFPEKPMSPDTTDKPSLDETYGKLPLSFEANRGQAENNVQFISRGAGYMLFLSSGEAALSGCPKIRSHSLA